MSNLLRTAVACALGLIAFAFTLDGSEAASARTCWRNVGDLQRPSAASVDASNRCPGQAVHGGLRAPADVEVDPATGRLLVADAGHDRIAIFSAKGRFIGSFGNSGTSPGRFHGPAAVAVDHQGNIWVGDAKNHRLQKFDSAGRFILTCGSEGSAAGQFSQWGPKGIAVTADDDIWVSDYSGRIQRFDSSCDYQEQVGSQGTKAGEFMESAAIDVGRDGRIWVTDWIQARVSVFSGAGEFLFDFGSSGDPGASLSHPDGLDVDDRGRVWVLDGGHGRVKRFSPDARFEFAFGSPGSGPGRFRFAWPNGLVSDGGGNLWVTDSGNDRVQRWRRSRLRR